VEKPEGKRPLRRQRRRWEYSNGFREIELGGEDWIDLAKNRDQQMALLNTVMNLRVQQNIYKLLSS
jgi:hypothetical protein